jgi:hypothetical protein
VICLARTPAKVQKKALRGRQLRVKFHAPRRRAGRPPPPHHADPCTYAILYTPYVLLSPCRRRRRRITTRLLGETREVFKWFSTGMTRQPGSRVSGVQSLLGVHSTLRIGLPDETGPPISGPLSLLGGTPISGPLSLLGGTPISGPLSFSGSYFWSPIVFGVPLFLVPYRFRGTPISGPLSFSGYPYFWSPIAFGGHPYFWSPIAVSKVWGELARFSTRFRNIRGGCTPETRHPPRMLRKRVENLASFPQPFRAQLVGVLARQISDLPR